jgi:arsenate reductase (glutaredoxin)
MDRGYSLETLAPASLGCQENSRYNAWRLAIHPAISAGGRMQVTIYHNPKCAKSRATLKLLEARGIRPIIIEYLKTPPSRTELAGLVQLLGIEPRALLRAKEPEFKQAGLANPKLSDAAILQAMTEHPKLIERPIVVAGKKAVLGRPPENVLKILK